MNDFERNAWCLLGIPVDVISLDKAHELLVDSVRHGSRCFFSTPNLNFIIEADKNTSFRDSVIQSDLVLLDGMPPLWVARWLGIPGIEKVSGSDLFDTLSLKVLPENEKIRVFLFGGEDGVAAKACQKINDSSPALECSGFHYPGFGSVTEMSNDGIMSKINASEASFIVVSLGAKKGQDWIMANLSKLTAPVISHLGAVVNFTAGNIPRAPGWMQVAGLEWLWRIWQEPHLWRRYLSDGLAFCWLLINCVVPYKFWRALNQNKLSSRDPVSFQLETINDVTLIRIEGICVYPNIEPLKGGFQKALNQKISVQLDLSGVSAVDGAFLGLCLVLEKHLSRKNLTLSFTGANRGLRKIFRWNRVEYLL